MFFRVIMLMTMSIVLVSYGSTNRAGLENTMEHGSQPIASPEDHKPELK